MSKISATAAVPEVEEERREALDVWLGGCLSGHRGTRGPSPGRKLLTVRLLE